MNVARPRVAIVLHGYTIAIEVPDEADHAAVAAILGGFPAPGAVAALDAEYAVRRASAQGWTLHRGPALTHRAATLEDALFALEWQLVTDLLARPLDHFHLHGAALRHPSGRMSVLVLGESGVGKTTITLALASEGFRPYTDDVVLIDVERLTPATFQRAFHVDEAARALVSGLRAGLPAEVAGLPHGYLRPVEWAVEPAPVGMIVFPKARGPDRPLLVGMPIADAATTLLSFSGSLETAPALALRAAARLTAAAPSYALYAGPLDATVELVSDTAQRLLAAQDNAPSTRT